LINASSRNHIKLFGFVPLLIYVMCIGAASTSDNIKPNCIIVVNNGTAHDA